MLIEQEITLKASKIQLMKYLFSHLRFVFTEIIVFSDSVA